MNSPMFFQPMLSMTTDEAKAYIKDNPIDSYTLLDVRQPVEYEEEHLPGAVLIPLGELGTRLGELDPKRPTLVYCRSGGRAGNAVSALASAGFEKIWNIGGTMQWHGSKATGAPEAGISHYDENATAADYFALGWTLEEGALRFYTEMAQRFKDETTVVFEKLAQGEKAHKGIMADAYRKETSRDEEPTPVQDADGKILMEGGLPLADALSWTEDKTPLDVLEFAMTLEANAHDRYIKAGRLMGDPVAKVFLDLAEKEKAHLDHLTRLFIDLYQRRNATT